MLSSWRQVGRPIRLSTEWFSHTWRATPQRAVLFGLPIRKVIIALGTWYCYLLVPTDLGNRRTWGREKVYQACQVYWAQGGGHWTPNGIWLRWVCFTRTCHWNWVGNACSTVASVLTHTCRWTPKSMGYYRVWVLAELVPGPFFVSYNAVLCFQWLYTE